MGYIKRNWIIYVLLFLCFYVSPIFVVDTGSGMFILMMCIPIFCLCISIIYGIRNGFHWWYVLAVAILFFSTVFIFYNSSALIYVAAYAVISMIGNFVGCLFCKKKGEE